MSGLLHRPRGIERAIIRLALLIMRATAATVNLLTRVKGVPLHLHVFDQILFATSLALMALLCLPLTIILLPIQMLSPTTSRCAIDNEAERGERRAH